MLITTDGRTLAAKGFVEINLHLNAFKCATHTHTHRTWCCQLPGSMRKAYAINSTKCQKGMQPVQTGRVGAGGVANKMKINCATRKKSKDFQGAHTDKQPKNISSTSAGAARPSSPLYYSLPYLPSLPPLTTSLWLPSVWRLSSTQGIRTCVQQPPLKRKGQYTTTRAQASCRGVCVRGVCV